MGQVAHKQLVAVWVLGTNTTSATTATHAVTITLFSATRVATISLKPSLSRGPNKSDKYM